MINVVTRILHNLSLTHRLILVLVGSLGTLALILAVGGAWYINLIAERTSDRVLAASAHSIADTVRLEDGSAIVNVPPRAFGMLEDNAKDNVYYTVTQGKIHLTGYSDFPLLLDFEHTTPNGTSFRYEDYLGQKVRVATAIRSIPRFKDPVIIQVAETLGQRRSLQQDMLIGLIALEVLLVAFLAIVLRPAVRLGLKPVKRLQTELAQRPSHKIHFEPLRTNVPREVRDLVYGFNGLLAQLEKSIDNLRQFVSDASHQICTPLAIIRTNIVVMSKHFDAQEEAALWLKETDSAAVRLGRLAAQLSALARAEDPSFAHALLISEFDLAKHIAAISSELANVAHTRRIRIEFLRQNDDYIITSDKNAVTEIFTNILDNAIRYSHPGETITVSIKREANELDLSVEDRGPGIPESDRPFIFNRFYRLNRDHNIHGSGLGLAIVKSLSSSLGIGVSLTNVETGTGLRVTLTFPATSPSN